MQLAGGEQDIYDDIMQSLAPLIMEKKPDGVIWWVGDGANGKSTLMDAIYKIFPGQLSSINVKRLTDERDTPSLNGTLANVVKEASEERVDDTGIYKAIGTHENFRVHKFHSQDDVEIRGNMHHIFSANEIPKFNDKGHSAKRRTYIIPFRERFESDPDFERKTFTPEMIGRLISEMCAYANRMKNQGYKYKWSPITQGAKTEYDAEASNAEEYVRQAMMKGLVAFEVYTYVRTDYENWCADHGYVPLGIGNLKKAFKSAGFELLPYRPEGANPRHHYRLPNIEARDLQQMSMGQPGLFTAPGFEPEPEPTPPEPQTKLVDVPPVEPPKKDIIGNRW
jgi:phage/plasmid-associated DNA primase